MEQEQSNLDPPHTHTQRLLDISRLKNKKKTMKQMYFISKKHHFPMTVSPGFPL